MSGNDEANTASLKNKGEDMYWKLHYIVAVNGINRNSPEKHFCGNIYITPVERCVIAFII